MLNVKTVIYNYIYSKIISFTSVNAFKIVTGSGHKALKLCTFQTGFTKALMLVITEEF